MEGRAPKESQGSGLSLLWRQKKRQSGSRTLGRQKDQPFTRGEERTENDCPTRQSSRLVTLAADFCVGHRTTMTESEELFEEFCTGLGIRFERVKTGDEQTPDYRMWPSGVEVVCEVFALTTRS